MSDIRLRLERDADFMRCWNASEELHRLILDRDVLVQMITVARLLIKPWGYKKARDHALDTYRFNKAPDEERAAYKNFLNRYFNKKAVAGTKRKHRPKTPLEVYEGGR